MTLFVDPLISRCRLLAPSPSMVSQQRPPLPQPFDAVRSLEARTVTVVSSSSSVGRTSMLNAAVVVLLRVNLGVAPLVHLEGIFGISVVSLRATLSPLLSHFLRAAARLSTFVGRPWSPGCCDNLRTCEVRGINHFPVFDWGLGSLSRQCGGWLAQRPS